MIKIARSPAAPASLAVEKALTIIEERMSFDSSIPTFTENAISVKLTICRVLR